MLSSASDQSELTPVHSRYPRMSQSEFLAVFDSTHVQPAFRQF